MYTCNTTIDQFLHMKTQLGHNTGNWLTLYSFLLYVFDVSLTSIFNPSKTTYSMYQSNSQELDFTDNSWPCGSYFPSPLHLNFSRKVPVPQLFSIEQTNFPNLHLRNVLLWSQWIPWKQRMTKNTIWQFQVDLQHNELSSNFKTRHMLKIIMFISYIGQSNMR